MLAKMSVEQLLMKANSYAKKGEVAEAQKLYQAVLQAFSKNKRAQQGLAALNKPKQNNATQSIPQKAVDQLVNLFNLGQLLSISSTPLSDRPSRSEASSFVKFESPEMV